MKYFISVLLVLIMTAAFLPSDEQFVEEVSDSDRPMVAVFTARWCTACQNDKKHYDDLEKKYQVVLFDYDENKKLAKQLGVKRLPTYIVYRDKQEVYRTTNVEDLLE